MTAVLMVAGEASGDLAGARLLSELTRLAPEVSAFGLGGDEMAGAGLERLAHSSEVAVVGITEVLQVLPRVRQVFRQILREAELRAPAAAILIDFPEFNLRLARKLKARGIPVVYYISPQIWAWRRGRVRTVARYVDRMLVLFPFEAEFYRRHGVEVVHVGHPLVDEVPISLGQAWDRGVPGEGEPYRLVLLPGSRTSEVEALLPAMLGAVRKLAGELPVFAQVVRAPTVAEGLLRGIVGGSGLPVEVVAGNRFERIAGAHLALCASGTATLEVGLLGTPMLVAYRLTFLTHLLGRLLVRLPHFSLVNLVLEDGVVPELIQKQTQPGPMAAAAAALLRNPERIAGMRAGLSRLRERLGEGGASLRAAREVAQVLGAGSAGGAAA